MNGGLSGRLFPVRVLEFKIRTVYHNAISMMMLTMMMLELIQVNLKFHSHHEYKYFVVNVKNRIRVLTRKEASFQRKLHLWAVVMKMSEKNLEGRMNERKRQFKITKYPR